MGERLVFRHLVLRGPARDYTVNFRDGVNVIAGPVLTGKSSVLQLLDYAMGGRRKPEYPEIAKCTELLVQCEAGGETLTIRRSLQNVSAPATLYAGTIEAMRADAVKGVAVAARQTPGQASISSEVMQRLGLGEVDVKTAPTQAASDVSTFSVRDLLFLVYLDQTRISDGRSAFFEREAFKAIKWRAGVEVVHAVYDEAATQLAKALQDAQAEEQRIARYLDAARQFLDEARVPPAEEVEAQLAALDAERAELLDRQTRLREATEAELGDNLALVRRRAERLAEAATVDARGAEVDRTLEQLGRLRVQYDRERAQLEFLSESERLVGSLPVVRCPACLQGVEHRTGDACYVCGRAVPEATASVSVEARLRATKRRILDLERYLDQLRTTRDGLQRARAELTASIGDLSRAVARVEQTSILPSARVLGEVGEALALVDRRRASAEEQRFLRERAQGQGSALLVVRERVRRLDQQRAALESSSQSGAGVAEALSERFRRVLETIRFPYLQGVRVDPATYRPVVRDAPYGAVSSKGAVSLIVTAWHLAVLQYALEQPSLFPMLLLLDSPLSHVGRDATDPAFKDQQIVAAFYGLLARLHAERAGEFQLIMCDNHAPGVANDLITTTFTRDSTTGRVGLISDE